MSILIKEMEMPISCTYCSMLEGDRDDGLCHAASRWLDDEEYWLWYQYPEGDVDVTKPSNCPLVPIPPHGRLIDADALKSAWDDSETGESFDAMSTPVPIIRALIDDAPTIIGTEDDNG